MNYFIAIIMVILVLLFKFFLDIHFIVPLSDNEDKRRSTYILNWVFNIISGIPLILTPFLIYGIGLLIYTEDSYINVSMINAEAIHSIIMIFIIIAYYPVYFYSIAMNRMLKYQGLRYSTSCIYLLIVIFLLGLIANFTF